MLKTDLSLLIAQATGLDPNQPHTEYPRDHSHGDYASPIALKLAKQAGKNPREVAAELLEQLELPEGIEADLAGPGFINFRLTDAALTEELRHFLDQPQRYRLPATQTTQPIIVEYSDPNVAKPLGVHHLLGTVIGQSLANIHRYLGYKVLSINHIGDWGSQFGKLIYAIKNWGNADVIEQDPINELLKLYIEFHDQAEKNPDIEDAARAEFKMLEDGDAANTEIWQNVVDWSMNDVQKTYDLLGGVSFDHVMGESFYSDKMDDIVDTGLEKKVFKIGDGGAIIAEFPEGYPTTIIKRSDGATVYITRDLATVRYRVDEWQPAKILYVVDVAQKLHFEQIFSIVDRLDLYEPDSTELTHVIYGRMSFADGKMSTRKGNIILLDQLINEAIDRSLQIVEEKNTNLSKDEGAEVARKVGSGCIKYAILSQNRNTNIVFSWDKVINLHGNSAAYLQYTYARASSIMSEVVGSIDDWQAPDQLTTHERELLRLIPKFPEAVVAAAQDYRPHFIAEYLFQFAQAFNGFYTNDPVLQAESDSVRNFRLAIISAAMEILKIGLDLLAGIEVPERM